MIANVSMTGRWECELHEIETGEVSTETFTENINSYVRQITSELLTLKLDHPDLLHCKCPKCGAETISIRWPNAAIPIALFFCSGPSTAGSWRITRCSCCYRESALDISSSPVRKGKSMKLRWNWMTTTRLILHSRIINLGNSPLAYEKRNRWDTTRS